MAALALHRPDVPWYAKALGAVVIACALSPIDLISDFIPVLGLLDDLLLVPLGVLAVRVLGPAGVLDECRAQAAREGLPPRTRWIAAAVVVLVWVSVALALLRWWLRFPQPGVASLSGIDSWRSADGSLSAVARVTWTFTTFATRSTLPSA